MIDIINEWINYLSKTKRYSPHTVIAYSQDIYDFINFISRHLENEQVPESLCHLTPQDIRSWLAHRHARNLSPKSTARALSCLRSFANYCSKQHTIDIDALSAIKSPRIKKSLPRPLSIDQTTQLLDEIELMSTDAWIGQRNKSLFLLLYGTGLRISEALSLKGDILINQGQVNVLGKGGKSRIIPILDEITQHLKDYAQLCPYPITATSPLFFGKQGKTLTASVAQKALRDYRRSVVLPDSVTPHALRHTCASHLMNASSDLRGIQELLGHASLSSTQIYTNLDQQKIIDTYKLAHPRKKMTTNNL